MKSLTPTPSNWSNKTTICSWNGVGCDDSGAVNCITLGSMSLTGTLPSGLNNSLRFLTKLDLSNNLLFETIPSLANLLDKLQEVYLDENNFTSIADGCFQGLIALQTLNLRSNINLAPWKFPIELNSSWPLNTLTLVATNLRGSLPDIFHSFPNLMYVYLSNNSLSGVLPKSFAQSKINGLFLEYQRNEKLSGTLEVLSSMRSLLWVWLQGNRFEGPIPDLSGCKDLSELLLQDNQLTGIVPASLANLSELAIISLDNNLLQGPLPVFSRPVNLSLGVNTTNGFCLDHVGPCDQRVTALLEIAADFGFPVRLARSWRGNNPCKGWSFITCDDGSKIRTVNLTNLNLTGTISPAFGNLTDLRYLCLGGNHLAGNTVEFLTNPPIRCG